MEPGQRFRYCRSCDEEFRPDVERCSDCGGPLEDRYEGMAPPDAPTDDALGSGVDDDLESADFTVVFATDRAAEAEVVARRLSRAAIRFAVTTRGTYLFNIAVPDERVDEARALLPRGAETATPSGDGFDAEKGYDACPACGRADVAGLAECPECGLGLAGPPPGSEGPSGDGGG